MRVGCSILILLPALANVCAAQEKQPASIPESEITALQEELGETRAQGASSVAVRRACKSVIRKAGSLLEAAPDATNRYAVLDILFQGQKRLLSLENTDRNRKAIFETCDKLAEAPDEYAELRLEADMLLSERELALNDATVAERAEALRGVVARYRGTKAEWRSLMIASLVAPKLHAFDLEKQIRETMSERFAGDHDAIAFRRKNIAADRLDAMFSGTYERVGGSPVAFPHDRLGHHCLMVFWSKDVERYAEFLGKVKEQRGRFPGRFEVYSLNVDDLPDAGEKILRGTGLDCTALHLPGGRASSAYRAYARMDPVALLVNGQGHVCLQRGQSVPWPPPTPARGKRPASQGPGVGMWLDNDRYLAQLRSLFIGDFLVAHAGKVDSIPNLPAIQSCFTPVPFRYRLTREESLANYRKAEALCAVAIKEHSEAPNLWLVRNRRIIALLGMWNLGREPKHLEEAVKEARATLAMDLPPGADVVSRFCLAKEALRAGSADPEELLPALVEAVGGENAPTAALAAAAILAIEANASTLHDAYRGRLLDGGYDDDPTPWPVFAFLRDRLHAHRLFWGNPGRWGHTREQRYNVRWLITAVTEPVDTNRPFRAELKTLGGGELSFPRDTAGAFSVIVFAEPPEDVAGRSNLVQKIDLYARNAVGKEARSDVDYSKDGKLTVAFLSEDANAVSALMKEDEWTFEAAMVPGGPSNPLIQRLGIVSPDEEPNVVLLRPDGTIAWTISGLTFPVQGCSVPGWTHQAIATNVKKCRTDAAFAALERGDFKKALSLFGELQPPEQKRRVPRDPWGADRLQGRALAYMGLKDWTSALAEIDEAIKTRLEEFDATNPCRCHGVVDMRLTKATILEQLGRSEDAEAERRLAAAPAHPHPAFPLDIARNGVPLGVFYDRLKRIRLAQWGEVK